MHRFLACYFKLISGMHRTLSILCATEHSFVITITLTHPYTTKLCIIIQAEQLLWHIVIQRRSRWQMPGLNCLPFAQFKALFSEERRDECAKLKLAAFAAVATPPTLLNISPTPYPSFGMH